MFTGGLILSLFSQLVYATVNTNSVDKTANIDWQNDNKLPISNRIVNGNDVSSPEVPFMLALFVLALDNRSGATCGGSIIHSKFALTAAHCFTTRNNEQEVRIFLNYYTYPYQSVPDYTSSTYFIHENYELFNQNDNRFDICLVQLENSDIFPTSTLNLDLPPQISGQPELTGDSEIFTIYGWGSQMEGSNERASILQKADVPLVDFNTCKLSYFYLIDNPEMFCAGYLTGQIDSCQGDSGGPAIYYPEKYANDFVSSLANPVQYGIVSFGVGCARTNFPGVYTNVAYFRDWIDNILGVQNVDETTTLSVTTRNSVQDNDSSSSSSYLLTNCQFITLLLSYLFNH